MLTIGCDPGYGRANACGLALLDLDPQPRVIACIAIPGPGEQRWYDIAAIAPTLDIYARYGAQLFGWELAHINPETDDPQTALRLAGLGGLLAGYCAARGLALMPVQPAEAKAALTGTTGADKDRMVVMARRLFGVPATGGRRSHREAIADAVGVALAAEAYYRRLTQTKETTTQ